MRFFRRSDKRAAAIDQFWRWWAGVRAEVAAAISAGDAERFSTEFNTRVESIEPDLQWELTPGTNGADHALVVTPAGNPELRATAARWLASAPAADKTWEYHAVRRSDPSVFSSKLGIAGLELDMAEIGYVINVDREFHRIDVVCFHPSFAALPDGARTQVTYLTLDWLLGEEDVEIWLGAIDSATDRPDNLRSPTDLRNAVYALADDDRWALMTGQDRDGRPRISTVSMPLRSARWPRFDTHVGVVLPYRSFNDGQLPVEGSLQSLRDFEDRLTASLAGDGALVAHETGVGQRTLHFYVDSVSDARARLESAAPDWAEGKAAVAVTHDPRFDRVRHLAG